MRPSGSTPPDREWADVRLPPRQVGRLLSTSGLAAWVLSHAAPEVAAACSAQASAVEAAFAVAPHDDVAVPAAALEVLVTCWRRAEAVLEARTGLDRAEQRRTEHALAQLRARAGELERLLAR